MTDRTSSLDGAIHAPTEEEYRECGIRMAEAAIRIERWRKKGKARRNHDLVTVLLSLGVLEDESPEHAEKRKRSDVMAALANEENQWHK